MATVLGVDGCPGGWVGAELAAGRVRWLFFADARSLLAHPADAVAVDIPIGLPEKGARACDVLARTRLGPRASSVFPAPVRAVLAARDYAHARELSVGVDGRSLSAQAFGILSRIREVDQTLQPGDHTRVVESHPEVAFRELAGRDLQRKKSAGGALARLQLLREVLPEPPDDPPLQAALDDCLDALVCAWTADRWLDGTAGTLGGAADALGVPMRIVY